jgi:hypothetical protein
LRKKATTLNKESAPQIDRFIETARKQGCDEDKERFEAKLGEIARHKPAKEPKAPKKERPGKKPSRPVRV